MASCYYATLVGGQCGPSSYNPSIVECVTIKDCNKDILNHCSQYKISNDCGLSGSESMLLLARAGNVTEFNVYFSSFDFVDLLFANFKDCN
jgi:hypothetical protein